MREITENHTITNIGAGIAKAIMQSNPLTGFFQTFYDEFASRQWQQRRNKWEEIFEEKLQNIKDEIDLTKIECIPNFAQILLCAGQGAMSDIEENKVILYVNTVINSIKHENIDDTKKHIFLNTLRDFTLLHIKILKYINCHQAITTCKQESLENINTCILDNLKSNYNESLLKIILLDLINLNFINYDTIVDANIGTTYYPKSLSPLGREFLVFINE